MAVDHTHGNHVSPISKSGKGYKVKLLHAGGYASKKPMSHAKAMAQFRAIQRSRHMRGEI